MTTYTKEQLDIEILKSKNDDFGVSLIRIDNHLSTLNNRIDTLDSHVKGQFNNFTNYILGIYGLLLSAALAHVTGIF